MREFMKSSLFFAAIGLLLTAWADAMPATGVKIALYILAGFCGICLLAVMPKCGTEYLFE